MPTILLAGAGGMIGKALIKHFGDNGYLIRTLVRDPKKADGVNSFYWNYFEETIDLKAFAGVDYIINLSGATVSKRWTLKYKKEIYDSRIMSIDFLFKTLKDQNIRIKKFISVSGTGYYGDTSNKELNENSATGNDFLAMVCRDWEQAVKQFSEIKTPSCILRVGVVMHTSGGFVPRIALPVKLFAGAHLGSGNQIISWISLRDLCRMFEHVIAKNLIGIYNATASNPLPMKEVDNTIARFYHRKIWLPNIPEKLLKLALGEMSQIVFASCHTSNSKIKTTGFVFQNEDLMGALEG